VAIAFVRGFARQSAQTLGNFWVDFTRALSTFCCRSPLWARCCCARKAPFRTSISYTKAPPLEGAVQTIPQGPLASQEAIKMIGTNGGGFTNANSAHPFENPTPFSNFLQMIFIFIIPAGLTYTFGKMVKDTRQGWALLRRHERSSSWRA
jgi:K+-transporting ATPase ATPase A chain